MSMAKREKKSEKATPKQPKCDHCARETNELYVCPRCEDRCCNNCCAGKGVICFKCDEEPEDDHA